MTRLLTSFAFLLVVSCAQTDTNITGYVGGRPIGRHKVSQVLYGKLTTESGLFQESTMGNLDVGFKYLANLITALVTAYIAGDVAQAREITTQMASKGATAVQIEQIRAAAAAQAAAITAGVRL